jgi:hypothetical protein
MPQPGPLLTFSNTILWLKVALSVAALALLYVRYREGKAAGASSKTYPLRTKVFIALAVLFSCGVFHNLGSFRGGSFVHYGEMFHYYLGTKYFKELGYYDLYNAVIVADTEQGNALARLPFYTDLRTYQNAQRATALGDADRIKHLFSEDRWNAFKDDVAFFKEATGVPRSPAFGFFLMDHGYNASPASTFLLGLLTNAVPVTQLRLLALLDVLLVAAMIALVFRTFGFEMGALFSTYFFVNILNDHEYISGSLLRYDWLLYVVAAVCLLERGRHASSAFFLTLAAMLRVFPAVLFYGVAVTMVQRSRATRTLDKQSVRFIATAAVTGLVLFLLPAVSLGSVVQPWKDFYAKTELHDSGVYVNHIGLRGIVLFEPSHLSLDKFVAAYKSPYTDDIVRHWQDVKENELQQKRPAIILCSLLVLACLTAILWKRKAAESESVLWPLLLVYAMSYLSHYYYAFLCLFVLLFFRRPGSLGAFVPLCLLLAFNIAALVTDHFSPSPIVFYTLLNIYLFLCLSAILGFELYTNVFRPSPAGAVASSSAPPDLRRAVKQRRRPPRVRSK